MPLNLPPMMSFRSHLSISRARCVRVDVLGPAIDLGADAEAAPGEAGADADYGGGEPCERGHARTVKVEGTLRDGSAPSPALATGKQPCGMGLC